MGRLPRLTSLNVVGWPDNTALVTVLQQYGSATQGHKQRLSLCGESVFCAAMRAAHLACPGLTQLNLELRAMEKKTCFDIDLEGPLFLPFLGGQLTEVRTCSMGASRMALGKLDARLGMPAWPTRLRADCLSNDSPQLCCMLACATAYHRFPSASHICSCRRIEHPTLHAPCPICA